MRPTLFDGTQYGQAIRPADLVIRDDQIETALRQRLIQPWRTCDFMDVKIGRFMAQDARYQGTVVRVVVNKQNMQGAGSHNTFFPGVRIAGASPVISIHFYL
jgi:hypothetical protein